MREWPLSVWLIFLSVFTPIIAVAIYLTHLYYQACILRFYAGIIGGEILLITLVSLVLRQSHNFHLHHYNVALLAIPLLGYPDMLVGFCHAFSSGAFVEGVSRWAYDPVWISKVTDHKGNSLSKAENVEPSTSIFKSNVPIGKKRIEVPLLEESNGPGQASYETIN